MAHVTGGGLIENLPRMFVDDSLAALVDLDSWPRPAVFGWLAQAGNVAEAEMLRTFNCGIGYVLCVAAADVDAALADETLEAHPDVGLDVLQQVAEMDRAVGVRQRAGHQDVASAGHGDWSAIREGRDYTRRHWPLHHCLVFLGPNL